MVPRFWKNKFLAKNTLHHDLSAWNFMRIVMSIAKEIAPHLPYLRRFARALSGTQPLGDAYVVQTLETLIADPSVFPQTLPAQQALYRVFLKLWSTSTAANKAGSQPHATTAVERNIEMLTPRARQAFILRTVEGFPEESVAAILDISQTQCRTLLDQATKEIAQQVATSVLIIEDEPIIALDIEAMVQELGHEVTGIARTHKEAIALMTERPPGLVLADVQLADGSSGLDAVNEILLTVNVPIIFITAYPERLLTGEKPEPAFLITKPFQPDAVKAAISQALFFDRKAGKQAA
jgi:DNA-directed RNA polymerase specialized sigma24 family protein/CheY-like chemotaxis protein